MIKEQIQQLSQKIFDDVVSTRRHLHSHPELSFQEVQTSAFVASKLDELGLQYQKMADNGLVALITGERPSDNVVALRADMDALPITETNDVPYKSRNMGVMHACGHDAHTSSLLSTRRSIQVPVAVSGPLFWTFIRTEIAVPACAVAGASMLVATRSTEAADVDANVPLAALFDSAVPAAFDSTTVPTPAVLLSAVTVTSKAPVPVAPVGSVRVVDRARASPATTGLAAVPVYDTAVSRTTAPALPSALRCRTTT